MRKSVSWSPTVLKFSLMLMEHLKGKPNLFGTRGVLCSSDGIVATMFSKYVGCMESNEAEVAANPEALQISCHCLPNKLVVEDDYSLIAVFGGHLLRLPSLKVFSFILMRLSCCLVQFL